MTDMPLADAIDREHPPLPPRRERIRALSDRLAGERAGWIERNRYFHEQDRRTMRFLVPAGTRVLELGCGIGDLLAALEPSEGLGIDFSPAMIAVARQRHPTLSFAIGDVEAPETIERIEGRFDYIILSDLIGALDDCEATLRLLHRVCTRRTRLIVAYYSPLWAPLLRLGERIGQKMPDEPHNFLSLLDIANLCDLAGFELIKRDWRQLVPRRLFGLGHAVNRHIGTLPGIRTKNHREHLLPLVPAALAYSRPAETAETSFLVTVPDAAVSRSVGSRAGQSRRRRLMHGSRKPWARPCPIGQFTTFGDRHTR